MARKQGSRWFAALWDRSTRREKPAFRRARRQVVSGVMGRVLEIGVGVGTNWQYLPGGVDYAGVEPDHFMIARARRHAAEAGREVKLHEVGAELLPFPDALFDTVFATLTLCSVANLDRSLAEIRRVLKPGGQFRFWEHVRPTGRIAGRLFDFVTPAWKRVGARCHPNRRTVEAIEAAGLRITELRRSRMGLTMPVVAGVAVKPGLDILAGQ